MNATLTGPTLTRADRCDRCGAQALATAARRPQLLHLALALAHLLHDDAGMLLVDVDHDLLDRLQEPAGLVALNRVHFFDAETGRRIGDC